jgi:hypothetical protein
VYTSTITNPTTGKQNAVKVWDINVPALYADLLAGKLTAKSLSLSLLGDDTSYQTMQQTEYGDSANNNWSLAIFEQALDWSIGLKILDFIIACAKAHKRFKSFKVAVTRNGDVFIVRSSTGEVIF